MLTAQTVNLSGSRQQVVYQSGAGPDLVFLHGLFGVTADTALIDALARQYTVHAPLAPGFADLAELDDLHDIHDLALHYDDVLDALKLEQAILIGHSFGAMIAAELAAHVPGRVSRLVLLSPLGQIKLAADRDKELQDLTWSQVLERGYVVAGTPDSVVQQLTEMERTMRVGHLMVLLHFGDMPKETVLYNTNRFAQEVMPRLRPLWSEFEDRWWPRNTLPLSQQAQPAPRNRTSSPQPASPPEERREQIPPGANGAERAAPLRV